MGCGTGTGTGTWELDWETVVEEPVAATAIKAVGTAARQQQFVSSLRLLPFSHLITKKIKKHPPTAQRRGQNKKKIGKIYILIKKKKKKKRNNKKHTHNISENKKLGVSGIWTQKVH